MAAIDPFAKRLFADAELRAKRLVAIMRIVIAISLVFVLVAANITTVAGGGPPADITELLNCQWLYPGLIVTAYFLLRLRSYITNRREL